MKNAKKMRNTAIIIINKIGIFVKKDEQRQKMSDLHHELLFNIAITLWADSFKSLYNHVVISAADLS